MENVGAESVRSIRFKLNLLGSRALYAAHFLGHSIFHVKWLSRKAVILEPEDDFPAFEDKS